MVDGGVLDASVVAVHDPAGESGPAFRRTRGRDSEPAEVVASAAEVAARADAVWVCTPTAAHREAVEAALHAKRAVFCEKPLSTDLAAAGELVAAVDAVGVPSQSGLVLRSAPVFRALKALTESGTLGRPMAAVFRDDQYFPIRGTYSDWRADVAQAGGGCLIEHSIHDVDILRFCFGEVDSLTARTTNVAGHEGVEDVAAVTLSFASGMEAQLTSVWHDIIDAGIDAAHRGVLPRRHGQAERRVPRAAAHPDQRRQGGAGVPLAGVGRRPAASGRPHRARPEGLRRGGPGVRRRRRRSAGRRSPAWRRRSSRTAWSTRRTGRPPQGARRSFFRRPPDSGMNSARRASSPSRSGPAERRCPPGPMRGGTAWRLPEETQAGGYDRACALCSECSTSSRWRRRCPR